MRTAIVSAFIAALCATPAAAGESRGVRQADPARAAHARKMVRALDDYDAQIARRQKQLRLEMRELERKSKGR